jgi:SAM-dependent methyltransferase
MSRRCQVIGRRALPEEYVKFNARWGAPGGLPAAASAPLGERLLQPKAEYGPFAYQLVSGTREFEYAWTFHEARTFPGARVLDVGGGVGGLQFVLALEGCDVVNVDPMHEGADGWPSGHPSARFAIDADTHDRVNAVFGTDVTLISKLVQDADLAEESFDRVVCVSVIEHLPEKDAREVMAHIGRLLKPGGLFATTIDLFLDLKPFGVLTENCYGTNVDVSSLVAASGLELVVGDQRELYGYPEFDRDRIVEQLDDVLVSKRYPVVSQALVLRKAG